MPVDTLHPRSALVLVDLQKGITALPAAHPAEEVVERAARLAAEFRARELPVVLRRGVGGVVLAGISTSIGVEATARSAHALGYEVVVAGDAVTDMVASAHENSVSTILLRLARLDATETIIAAL